jgi:hypothetical protein
MTNIEFKKPNKSEAIALMVMLFSFFALFQASNLWLNAGVDWTTNLTSKIPLPGALMFWLFFLLFHIALMFVMARSVISKSKNSTWNGYDFFVGFAMLVGLYFITISTVYGVFRGTPNIEFMWNISYPLLLQIGLGINSAGILWFGFTD